METYIFRTRFTGYPVRYAVNGDGSTSHDWFLVNIDGVEHARPRKEMWLENAAPFQAEVL